MTSVETVTFGTYVGVLVNWNTCGGNWWSCWVWDESMVSFIVSAFNVVVFNVLTLTRSSCELWEFNEHCFFLVQTVLGIHERISVGIFWLFCLFWVLRYLRQDFSLRGVWSGLHCFPWVSWAHYSIKTFFFCCKIVKITNEPEHSKTYNVTWASNKDSDQPAQLHNLIRGFHIICMQFIIFAWIRNKYIV